jgi:hypothetical protein
VEEVKRWKKKRRIKERRIKMRKEERRKRKRKQKDNNIRIIGDRLFMLYFRF